MVGRRLSETRIARPGPATSGPTGLSAIGIRFLKKTLQQPLLTGARAFLFGFALVALPTLIHLVASGGGGGIGLAFIVYVPSVVLAALFMKSWQAALIALASAAAGDWFFLEQENSITFSAADLIGGPVFLASSALIIGVVRAIRALVHECFSPRANPGKVVFSEEKGHAWAHWHSDRPSLPLGPHEEVAAMMEDYIAQVEIGKRLTVDEDVDALKR